MSGPNAKTTRIMKRSVDGVWAEIYWSESNEEWTEGDGTRYESIVKAQQAIVRFSLTDCVPVSHG